MTPTKQTYRRTVAADSTTAATAGYTKAVPTPAAGRLGAVLYCKTGAVEWCTRDVGGTAPANTVMGQLAAGQSITIGAEDTQDVWVRAVTMGTYCFTELVQ